VNGAITPEARSLYFYLDPAARNEALLLDLIRNGHFIMLYGARAVGKSTRAYRAVEQLRDKFCCLMYSAFQDGIVGLTMLTVTLH